MRDYLTHAMHDAGRVELRHQNGDRWVFGLFDDPDALHQAIQQRANVGNLYTSLNAPRLVGAPNRMGGQALRDDDITHVVRLPFDFDPVRPKDMPSDDAELAAALTARDRLVAALAALGWPQPLLAMSGNGAHAVYRCRLRATSELEQQMRVIYTGLKRDFDTVAVSFDTSVRNPGRIWRLYGTRNRKGTPTHDRPHRIAHASIPGRWEAVSPRQIDALANAYARRPAARPTRSQIRVSGSGDYSTLDIAGWFESHGSYRRHLHSDMHAVRCPWDADHSTVDGDASTSTVVWAARDGMWPSFKCLHAHCDGRGIRDVLALWPDADDHCSSEWRASR